jgi:hypothetical protein
MIGQPKKLFITFVLLTLVSFLTVYSGIQVSEAKAQSDFLQDLHNEFNQATESDDDLQPYNSHSVSDSHSVSAQKKDSNAGNLVVTERFANGNIPSGATGTITSTCAKDEVVTGGGFDGTFNSNQVISSRHSDNPDGWAVTFKNDGGANQVTVYAECAQLE